MTTTHISPRASDSRPEEVADLERVGQPGGTRRGSEHIDVVVVGGGQAGLSVGYHLARRRVSFLIVDASERIGDVWRKRWHSLRLFTPAKFDGLDGLPFPAPGNDFPTKDQMADYLELYAKRFALPVRSSTRVTRLSRDGSSYVLETSSGTLRADHVVVAMSNHQRPRLPEFAKDLRPDILQLHTIDYRSPQQLKEGPALIVGAANSGAEIARDLFGTRPLWLAGRHPGQLPFRIDGFWSLLFLARLFGRILAHRVLTVRTRVGRRVRSRILHTAAPLVRVRSRDIQAMGIRRVPRVIGARDGLPLLEDDRVVDVPNVIWCTGFHPGFDWIDLRVFDEAGDPRHESGVVPDEPGLYFVGLHFLHALSSPMIHGVGRDAARIAGKVASRVHRGAHRPPPASQGLPHSSAEDSGGSLPRLSDPASVAPCRAFHLWRSR